MNLTSAQPLRKVWGHSTARQGTVTAPRAARQPPQHTATALASGNRLCSAQCAQPLAALLPDPTPPATRARGGQGPPGSPRSTRPAPPPRPTLPLARARPLRAAPAPRGAAESGDVAAPLPYAPSHFVGSPTPSIAVAAATERPAPATSAETGRKQPARPRRAAAGGGRERLNCSFRLCHAGWVQGNPAPLTAVAVHVPVPAPGPVRIRVRARVRVWVRSVRQAAGCAPRKRAVGHLFRSSSPGWCFLCAAPGAAGQLLPPERWPWAEAEAKRLARTSVLRPLRRRGRKSSNFGGLFQFLPFRRVQPPPFSWGVWESHSKPSKRAKANKQPERGREVSSE